MYVHEVWVCECHGYVSHRTVKQCRQFPRANHFVLSSDLFGILEMFPNSVGFTNYRVFGNLNFIMN